MIYDYPTVLTIYTASDGDATKGLYAALVSLGAAGAVATDLFRACKASERAKVYRGGVRGRGSYRGMAYDKKQWAMDNLCDALSVHSEALGITWGWRADPKQEFHSQVLYIDLPTGQVSFHTAGRGKGPDYTKPWDGVRNEAPTRICRWIASIMEKPNESGV